MSTMGIILYVLGGLALLAILLGLIWWSTKPQVRDFPPGWVRVPPDAADRLEGRPLANKNE